MIRSKRPLFLHKDEWDRLKNVRPPSSQPREINKHIQSLIEKSQNWIKSWPDSVKGHITKLEKQKEKQHAKDLVIIEMFKTQHKNNFQEDECIEKAKEMIFDDSCFGRRLISALLESKALEERDVQIEFQKKIRQESNAENNQQIAIGCSLQNAVVMENKEKQQEMLKQEKDREIAQINKDMYTTQFKDKLREKERKKQTEIEDMRLIQQLIEEENAREIKKKSIFNQELQQFKADEKKFKEEKAKREMEDARKVELWRQYEERKKTIVEKINKKRFEISHKAINFELVKRLNDEEKKRYDEFINNGIASHTRKIQMKEEDDKRKGENERRNQYLLVQSYKKLSDAKRMIQSDVKKCTCDKQFITTNTTKCNRTRSPTQSSYKKGTTFASSNNRLVNNLELKKQEPTPWSGAAAAHATFARRAGGTLRRCRYKRAARLVVDDYRKSNGLTEQSLPVPDYY